MRPAAILFDLDGTLVDSLGDIACGLNALLEEEGLAPFPEAEVEKFVGRGARVLLERAWTARGLVLEGAALDAMLARYAQAAARTGCGRTRFFPGVPESLARLRVQGIPLALVTNKNRAMAQAVLEALGVRKWFASVTAGDDGLPVKPAPDMLLAAAHNLGADPFECIMVGDSANDALAARAAGMTAWLLTTGYNEGVPVAVWARSHGFPHVFGSLSGALADRMPD